MKKRRGKPVYTDDVIAQRKQLKELFEEYSPEAFKTVVAIMRSSKDNTNRLKACTYILDKVTPDKYVVETEQAAQKININLVPVGKTHRCTKEELAEIRAAQQDQDWIKE